VIFLPVIVITITGRPAADDTAVRAAGAVLAANDAPAGTASDNPAAMAAAPVMELIRFNVPSWDV
jgi:hypothetical protein